MDNTTIQTKFNSFKTILKNNSITILFVLVVVIAGFVFMKGRNTSRAIKDLQKENKMLMKQMDSLNTAYSFDSIARANVFVEQEYARTERENARKEIRDFVTQQLNKYKNLYDKNPTYTDVNDDSLTKLFNNRFDY
jgi:Na+-transporting NADH:ubiquinone oxidoreductase subunit NqrC